MLDSTDVLFGFPFVHLCQFVQRNHWLPDFSGFVFPDSIVFHTTRVPYLWVDQAAREIGRLSCRMSSSSVMLKYRVDSEGF